MSNTELPKEIIEIINKEAVDKYPVVEKVGHCSLQSDHRKKDRQRQDYRFGATAWAQKAIGFGEWAAKNHSAMLNNIQEVVWFDRENKTYSTEELVIEYLKTLPQ